MSMNYYPDTQGEIVNIETSNLVGSYSNTDGDVRAYVNWKVTSQDAYKTTLSFEVKFMLSPYAYGNVTGLTAANFLNFSVRDNGSSANYVKYLYLNHRYQGDYNSNVSYATSTTDTFELIITRDSATNLGSFDISLDFRYSSTKDFWASTSTGTSSYTVTNIPTTTVSGSVATLISVPTSFNDEENPTIQFRYDKGTDVVSATVSTCISFTGAEDDIPYRDITLPTDTYTYDITATERQVFWTKITKGAPAVSVRFYLRTVETLTSGEVLTSYSYAPSLLTFVNYLPIITPIFEDNGGYNTTLSLTGDKNTIVKGVSFVDINTQAVARKGAKIKYQWVYNANAKTVFGESSTGTVTQPTSPVFRFEIGDDRGNVLVQEVNIAANGVNTWLDYVGPSFKLKTTPINGDGEFKFTLSGKYWEGNFGAESNQMEVIYYIKEQSQEEDPPYVTLVADPHVSGEHNFTYEHIITGLDYTKTYLFTVYIVDKIWSGGNDFVTVSSTTIFDWSVNDFAFHIPVQMDKGFMYPQTVLWSGAALMDEDEEIELDYPVSEQPTGIVLVFSLYRNGAAENVSICSFFKSRAEIQYLMPYGKHTFLMGINSNLSVFGAKYLTITDNKITGFEGNANSGTAACGITFDNSQFVLRYVIGV